MILVSVDHVRLVPVGVLESLVCPALPLIRCSGRVAGGMGVRWRRVGCGRWSGPIAVATWAPRASGWVELRAGRTGPAGSGWLQGGGPRSAFRAPARLDPDTGRYRRLSRAQKEVNAAHARQREPGERANAQLKTWTILREIRCCPRRPPALINAVTVLIQSG